MHNITAILISFLRPGYTKACVESLRREYPDIKIIVGENGEHNEDLAKACAHFDAKYIQLPFDSGVCVGRNTLIKEVDTEYVLVGDDDFYYDKNAKVSKMLKFLQENKQFDLIGGRVLQNGEVKNYQGYITKHADHFESIAIDSETATFEKDNHSGLRFCPADLTFNFFVARTDKVRQTPWDEEIKVAYEHFSWFYDFKCAGGKVAFTPDAVVLHKPDHVDSQQQQEYAMYRNRKEDKDRFFKKYEIRYTISMNGAKTYASNHVMEIRKNDTKFVDFLITTFKRPKAVERLLDSIAKYYPMANVYVADQNELYDRQFYKTIRDKVFRGGLIKRPSIEKLPYDCGLSYARNHLAQTTPNMYKLILDDDMEFIPETDIGKMVKLLDDHPKCGVVGGMVKQLGQEVHFEFDFQIDGDTLYQMPDKQPIREHQGIRYKKTSCVLNFALMRKDLFNYLTWDTDLKVTEHMDFYLRMKNQPYYILYTPDVVIDHPPTARASDYKEMRQRTEFQVKMMKKHGLRRIKYLNGQVTEVQPDGSLKRYKEAPVN